MAKKKNDKGIFQVKLPDLKGFKYPGKLDYFALIAILAVVMIIKHANNLSQTIRDIAILAVILLLILVIVLVAFFDDKRNEK